MSVPNHIHDLLAGECQILRAQLKQVLEERDAAVERARHALSVSMREHEVAREMEKALSEAMMEIGQFHTHFAGFIFKRADEALRKFRGHSEASPVATEHFEQKQISEKA